MLYEGIYIYICRKGWNLLYLGFELKEIFRLSNLDKTKSYFADMNKVIHKWWTLPSEQLLHEWWIWWRSPDLRRSPWTCSPSGWPPGRRSPFRWGGSRTSAAPCRPPSPACSPPRLSERRTPTSSQVKKKSKVHQRRGRYPNKMKNRRKEEEEWSVSCELGGKGCGRRKTTVLVVILFLKSPFGRQRRKERRGQRWESKANCQSS